ncbi:DUF2334 domain-containing protein [Thermodesulfatator atlanticus]|uniref:DUF2334 domain-containing protein n=1 Tax=Thermodesulfatator atlanticus TaxID=501497 RepID=UPI0003B3D2E2|nr:DUF2334 domain-containing protein [Thermodesulfatator atlanticus]
MEKKIIIELHDVSPFYKNELLNILRMLYEHGIKKFSILLTPNFKGRYRLDKDNSFKDLIKCSKQEIILHGLYHEGKFSLRHILATNREGEFADLSKEETRRRIVEGNKILKNCGIDTHFFVAPAWINNKYLEKILTEQKFKGIGNRWSIKIFNKKKIFSPIITLSNRNILSFLSKKSAKTLIKLYKNFETIRFAIHMQDANDSEKIILWKELIEQTEKRRLISYEDLTSES